MRGNPTVGDFSISFQMNDPVENGADVTSNRCRFNGHPLAVVHQPAIERQGEGALGGFHTGVES